MAEDSDKFRTITTFRVLKAARCGHLHYIKRVKAELEGLAECLKLKEPTTLGNIKDKDGRTAFHHAAMGGTTHVCDYLLNEVKINHINLRDGIGETPLHQAIIAGHRNTAVYLIGNGANPNAATDAGDTPLHYAALKGDEELLRLLISKGAEVNAKSDSSTPLIWAAYLGDAKAMKPNMIHLPSRSALAESVLSGSLECVKLLLQARADPNMPSFGVTVLHFAVEEADTEIIKCLLDGGANPDAVNKHGVTPVELSVVKGHHVVGFILFPRTTPFPSISSWSYFGIMDYLFSEESERQWVNNKKKLFQQLKSKGEAEFKRKEYTNAIYWYNECFLMEIDNVIILSNLSCCWSLLNEGDKAMAFAQKCVALRPNWPKAHCREGVAWNLVKRFDQAAASFKRALELDPQNKEIGAAYREALLRLPGRGHD